MEGTGKASKSNNTMLLGAAVVVIIIIVAAALLLSGGGKAASPGGGSSGGSGSGGSGGSGGGTTSTGGGGGGSSGSQYAYCAGLNFTASGSGQTVTKYCTWDNASRLNITISAGNFNTVLKFYNTSNGANGTATYYTYACNKGYNLQKFPKGLYTVVLTVNGAAAQTTCGSNTTVVIKAA